MPLFELDIGQLPLGEVLPPQPRLIRMDGSVRGLSGRVEEDSTVEQNSVLDTMRIIEWLRDCCHEERSPKFAEDQVE